jgi:hypothetical protein
MKYLARYDCNFPAFQESDPFYANSAAKASEQAMISNVMREHKPIKN